MFPVWLILFGLCAVLVYLAVGGALLGDGAPQAVFLPPVAGD